MPASLGAALTDLTNMQNRTNSVTGYTGYLEDLLEKLVGSSNLLGTAATRDASNTLATKLVALEADGRIASARIPTNLILTGKPTLPDLTTLDVSGSYPVSMPFLNSMLQRWILGESSELLFGAVDRAYSASTGVNRTTGVPTSVSGSTIALSLIHISSPRD